MSASLQKRCPSGRCTLALSWHRADFRFGIGRFPKVHVQGSNPRPTNLGLAPHPDRGPSLVSQPHTSGPSKARGLCPRGRLSFSTRDQLCDRLFDSGHEQRARVLRETRSSDLAILCPHPHLGPMVFWHARACLLVTTGTCDVDEACQRSSVQGASVRGSRKTGSSEASRGNPIWLR